MSQLLKKNLLTIIDQHCSVFTLLSVLGSRTLKATRNTQEIPCMCKYIQPTKLITSPAEELGKASRHELAYGVVENNVQLVTMETIFRVYVIKWGFNYRLHIGATGKKRGKVSNTKTVACEEDIKQTAFHLKSRFITSVDWLFQCAITLYSHKKPGEGAMSTLS